MIAPDGPTATDVVALGNSVGAGPGGAISDASEAPVGTDVSPPIEPVSTSVGPVSGSAVAIWKLAGAELTGVGFCSEFPPQEATITVIIAKTDNRNLYLFIFRVYEGP